jgi:hypothetical protein
MSRWLKRDKILIVAASVLSLMLNSCDWGVIGSNPDRVIVRPAIINPVEEPIKLKLTTPPTSKFLDSRPGFVFNPYTGNIVDVRGLASGLLVRDPEDPDNTHTFYVP